MEGVLAVRSPEGSQGEGGGKPFFLFTPQTGAGMGSPSNRSKGGDGGGGGGRKRPLFLSARGESVGETSGCLLCSLTCPQTGLVPSLPPSQPPRNWTGGRQPRTALKHSSLGIHGFFPRRVKPPRL